MNAKQRNVLKTVLFVLVAMFLFPPFHEPVGQGVMGNSGFSFILSPPQTGSYATASVNSVQLVAQWIGVMAIGAVAYFLAQGQETTATNEPRRWLVVLGEAFRRSKTWIWIGLAFIVVPIFWARDSHALAIKLIGNTGAAVLVYAFVFFWHLVRVLRGLPAATEKPSIRTSLKRVLVATALGTLAVAALVFFSDTTRSSSKPWERDWSSSGRDLFEEAGISPGQRPDERSPVKSDPLEMPRDSGGRDGRSEGVKWEDFKPIAPVPSRGATTSDRGQSIDDFLGGAKPAAAPEAAEKTVQPDVSNTPSRQ
ncbi:MAG: hypothetical protein ACOY5G_04065 [Pseudomonadota bacterium]